MQVIDGRALAREILNDTKHHIAKHGITPGLAILLVGQDPASHLYVQLKEKAASKIGVRFEKHLFPAATTQATIIQTIKTLNQRTDVHGIVVQLPLPKPLDENAVVEAIAPAKDVDGFHPENIRRLIEGKVVLVPALAQSIVALVRQPGIVLKNKNAVIVAHSRVFFEPVAYLLRREGVSAEFLSPGSDVDAVKNADIVIIAVGHENFLAADNIKNGAIVIDVGINKTPHGVVGDVDAEAVRSLDGFITPVPGGVGPVTVASLLANTAAAVARRP